MKKKEIIVLSISIISLITVSLYQTLATDITMNKVNSTDADLSYTFDITDQTGRVVNVASGATKILDVFVTNPNNGTIKYGIAYTPSSVKTDDITIAQLSTSKDSVSGLINKDERKQITLVIINNSTSDITLSLVSVTGYEHGGDLIVPSNHALIKETYEMEEPFEPINAADYIESLLPNNPETMNNDDPDGNVRYMGADPNNYVSFNNELWRIIGVFDVASTDGGPTEKRLKIIRNDSIGNMAWDSNGVNDWTQASLQEYLNGDYYNSLDYTAQSLIVDTCWNLGGSDSPMKTPKILYEYERETDVYNNYPTYWIGKIALMYLSDYGYATSGGASINRNTCLATGLGFWSGEDCTNNDYLVESATLTHYTMDPFSVFGVSDRANLPSNLAGLSDSPAYDAGAVKPTVYLKFSVLITSGDGSKDNPYVLSA